MTTVLQTHKLTKTYGTGDTAVAAVRDVDLDVSAGEVVLVMGPSGSGKTTLLLMIGAMLRPTSGSIRVDGLDVAAVSERRLPALRARHFGFVFQDFNLLLSLTALENVELACNIAGLHGHAAADRARSLLDRLAAAMPTATVQTRAGFVHEEGNITRDMSADSLRIVTLIGLLIALAVIALTLFTLTLARLRDYGVLKALGAPNRRLAAVVATQAAWSVALALAVALLLAIALAAIVSHLAPTLSIIIAPASVARTGAGALIVGALGSIIPLRRVARVDPASVFRRAA